MKCNEMMTGDLYTCTPTATALECASAMRDRDIGFIPVVNEDGKCIGTLTDRDLCLGVLAVGKPANESIEGIMKTDVVSCSPEDDVEVAEEKMAKHQKQRMLVTDGQGRPMGVISLADLALAEPSSDRTQRVLRSIHTPNPTQRQAQMR